MPVDTPSIMTHEKSIWSFTISTLHRRLCEQHLYDISSVQASIQERGPASRLLTSDACFCALHADELTRGVSPQDVEEMKEVRRWGIKLVMIRPPS